MSDGKSVTVSNTDAGVADGVVSLNYAHLATADNTRKAYRHDVKLFIEWGGSEYLADKSRNTFRPTIQANYGLSRDTCVDSQVCPYWTAHIKRFGDMVMDFSTVPKSVESSRRRVKKAN